MLLFCPNCSNLLTITPRVIASNTNDDFVVEDDESAGGAYAEPKHIFMCPTCPYIYPLTQPHFSREYFNEERPARGGLPQDVLDTIDSTSNATTHQSERSRVQRKRRKVDVLGGSDAWANVDKTDVPGGCPNEACNSTEAYFMQVQIRGADEPMTSIFKCCGCLREWRE